MSADTKVRDMAQGNPEGAGRSDAADGRDLTMRRREYWETLPHPARPHHWLEVEFEAFLYQKNYPRNTIADRLAVRVSTIKRALETGEFVPACVLSEPSGADALEQAICSYRAGLWAQRAERETQERRADFRRDLVAAAPAGAPDGDRLLVLSALKAAQTGASSGSVDPKLPKCTWEFTAKGLEWPLLAKMEVNGRGNRWLSVRCARLPVESHFGELHRIDSGLVDEMATKGLAGGDLTWDGVWALLGFAWRPPVIRGCSSARVDQRV